MTINTTSQYKKLKRLQCNVWGNTNALKYRANKKTLYNTKVEQLTFPTNPTNEQSQTKLLTILKKKQEKLNHLKIKMLKKISPYGERLIEKQKLKLFYYNMNETTLQRYYTDAKRQTYTNKYKTFDHLLIESLEARLDIVLYRARLCESISAARLAISHGCVCVNNKIVNIKSYNLKQYDIIQMKYHNNQITKYTSYIQQHLTGLEIPPHLEVNYKLLKCILVEKPKITNIEYPINIDFEKVREFYK
jgi:small subunit ribosomal protein S4